jgi:two-component system sensor histidine kinase/response regulator
VNQDQLRESEEWLRLALECGRMGVWDWDVLNDVVKWSEETYQLFGLPSGDPAGGLMDVHAHLMDEDRPKMLARVREALEGGSGDLYAVEFRLRGLSGRVRWAEARGRVIRDASGRAVRMMGVISDATERKAHEEEMARMRERAEAAARAKAEFLANMSHEIRTPLHAVIGMAGLLDQSDLGPDQKECVETIRAGANHLLSLVDEILEFSKIEAGRVELSREAFSPAACLRQVVSLLAPRAAAKGLQLRTTFAPDLPNRVSGDPARLRQVLVNLIGNAIKFTPRGSVAVSLRRGEDAQGNAGVSRWPIRGSASRKRCCRGCSRRSSKVTLR